MSDWIKMRSGLLTNPKVIRMARTLAENHFFMEWWTRGTKLSCDKTVYEVCDVTVVTRVTVGSLLSVWAAVNDVARSDGFVKGVTLFEVDEMAGVPGFGEAMEAVEWVQQDAEGLVFPNFCEHNTVGKERPSTSKTGAQRTKEWRDRKTNVTTYSDVTVTSQCDHREEKRREEDKGLPPSATSTEKPSSSKKPRKTAMPDGFERFENLSARLVEWARQKGFGQRYMSAQLEAFVSYVRRSGQQYVDWDEALMTAARENWAKLAVANSAAASEHLQGAI